MTQKRIIAEKGGSKKPTKWSKFKDRLSSTFTKNTEKLIRKSMASRNIGTTIDLIGSVSGETQKEALEWLKKNGKYHNGMNKRIYKKALEEDGVWTELFADAYRKADDAEKNRLWSMMSSDLNTLITRVEFCDMIDGELRNASRIYVEIGKVDRHANHTICWDLLKELFEGRGGNSLEVRKFALESLCASGYDEIEFWESILTSKENGDYKELKKHAIKLLLEKETEGGEGLVLKHIDELAGQLKELMAEEISGHEAERIMAVIFKRMKKSESAAEHASIYMYILSMARDESWQMRMNVSVGLERLSEKDKNVHDTVLKGFLLDAKNLAGTNVVMNLAESMKILETLEFTGKTEEIKKLIDKKIRRDLKKMTGKMFDVPDIEKNLHAANILLVLSRSGEARKQIKETAIPEMKDIAEDEDSSMINRKKAEKMLELLENVVSDEEQ